MITRFLSKRLIPALALVLLLATNGLGQSTSGSITGTVKDGAGAPVPDANVLVTNPATNLTRKVTTNSAGIFTAPQLPPGNYTIAVEKRPSMCSTIHSSQASTRALPFRSRMRPVV